MKKRFLLLTLGLIFQPLAAIAGQYDVVHKWINPTDGATYVYIPDQPANQPLINMRFLQNKMRLVKVDNCGIGKISDTDSNIIEGFKSESGTGFNQSINDAATVPKCTLDSSSGTYSNTWNPPTINSALKIASTWYLKLSNTAGAVNVNVYSRKLISSNTNDCGFVRIKDTPTRPLTQFELTTVNGFQSFGLAELPSVTAPMICKKGVEYQPLD